MSSAHVIQDVTLTAVLAPLNAEFRGSHYHIRQRGTIIIQLHSSEGIVGEAYLGDEDTGLPELLTTIQKQVVPLVIGADALSPARLWNRLYPITYNIRRAKRTSQLIVGAFDAAMWDLVGKAAGLPLWRIWGGAQERLPIIAIGGYYGNVLGTLREEIAYYREMGLAGIKFKVGGVSPAEDAARVAEAREAGGDDFILCVDANQGLSVPAAIELSKRLDGLNIRWFEEPVTWHNDRRGMRDVRMIGPIPVCAGQSELSSSGARDLMETGSIDVCNFDASMAGGPTAWLRTAAIAQAYDVMMAHHEEPQVSSHLLASQPHGTYVECFHPDRDPFWWKLIASKRQIEDGNLVMSERPGLGWDLDWDYIDKYRVTAE